MIERVGLLNRGLEGMVPAAWELYCNWEYAGQPMVENKSVLLVDEFKNTFSRDKIKIHFMGLWDTINSVGIIRDRLFPYTARSSIVQHVRHAVSIDERRSKFKQVLFAPSFETANESPSSSVPSTILIASSFISISRFFLNLVRKKETRLENIPPDDTIELYFPGNHGDCGGGWPLDPNGLLSDIPLRWMLLEAIRMNVKFKPRAIHRFNEKLPLIRSLFGYDHDMLELKKSSTASQNRDYTCGAREEKLSLDEIKRQIETSPSKKSIPSHDGNGLHNSDISLPNQPVKRYGYRGNESLLSTLSWWLVELLPVGYKKEDIQGKWHSVFFPNIGTRRKISPQGLFHWSLYYRIHFVEDYLPQNLPERDLGEKLETLLETLGITGSDIKMYCKDLTIAKLKHDTDASFWSQVPDELRILLDENHEL